MKHNSPTELHYWKLYIDGASRNNPGPSGAGIVIMRDNKVIEEAGYYLGTKTNNQAEYLALLIGLFLLRKYELSDKDMVLIISDSQLLVRQLQGHYKVKNDAIKKYYQLAQQLLVGLSYDVMHVLRNENVEADRCANQGIDTKKLLPKDVQMFLIAPLV